MKRSPVTWPTYHTCCTQGPYIWPARIADHARTCRWIDLPTIPACMHASCTHTATTDGSMVIAMSIMYCRLVLCTALVNAQDFGIAISVSDLEAGRHNVESVMSHGRPTNGFHKKDMVSPAAATAAPTASAAHTVDAQPVSRGTVLLMQAPNGMRIKVMPFKPIPLLRSLRYCSLRYSKLSMLYSCTARW